MRTINRQERQVVVPSVLAGVGEGDGGEGGTL